MRVVIALTGHRKPTVKALFTPSLGAPVYDGRGTKIGSVFNAFRSIKEPYVPISLDEEVGGADLINYEVFVDVKS